MSTLTDREAALIDTLERAKQARRRRPPLGRDILFLASPGFGRPAVRDIIAAVAREHSVPAGAISSGSRVQAVVNARHAAIRLAVEAYPDLNRAALARRLGVDSATVRYALGLRRGRGCGTILPDIIAEAAAECGVDGARVS